MSNESFNCNLPVLGWNPTKVTENCRLCHYNKTGTESSQKITARSSQQAVGYAGVSVTGSPRLLSKEKGLK